MWRPRGKWLPNRAGIAKTLILAAACALFLPIPLSLAFWHTASDFADYRPSEPSRLYGRPASPELEAPLLATYYGPEQRECRAVAIDRLPPHVFYAVLAAEDDRFFVHNGVSATAVLRAALVNLGARRIRQGGSTITQQLARNLYLTRERTWARKYREALLSLVLEFRYPKKRLLEAYLNEIYLGRAGGANLVGVGAASQAYFGKPAEQMELHEAALLAALIRSPGEYSPIEHADRARARRDYVLTRMASLGWAPQEEAAEAARRPLDLAPPAPPPAEVGYFAAAMAEEARRRFRLGDVRGQGYSLYSTLNPLDQAAALEAVREGLVESEAAPHQCGPLQAALVSLDPNDGSILAWVGGRDYGDNQFDRVDHAARQAGSAFKPVVYASALRTGVNLADEVADTPILVRMPGRDWRPQNDDRAFHGDVSVRAALERSLNVPTVRIALQAGLSTVATLAAQLGLTVTDDSNPSLALGAVDVSPLQMARAYGAFAAAGIEASPYGLERVLDARGVELPGLPVPGPQRVLDEDTAFLVTAALQGAMQHGTGARSRGMGLKDPLAGKTGTSDDRRDAWFAGFAPERVTVVWVGRDDNAPAGLSGSNTALPIWVRFMSAVRPEGGYRSWEVPSGVETAEIDPDTGYLATPLCPRRRTEYFYLSRLPQMACPEHDGFMTASFVRDASSVSMAGETVILLDGGSPDPARSWMALDRNLAERVGGRPPG